MTGGAADSAGRPLREVIARHDLIARRGLGQHFLLDGNLTAKIVRAAGALDGVTVIEVGAGPGGLTRALLASAARAVVAIERDPRCVAALDELAAVHPDRLTILAADALETDAASIGAAPRAIVANLPYNISTALLLRWLARADAFVSMTLMFQKEVADRLSAKPRTKAYGRLSVMAQWRCRVDRCFDLQPAAFVPPPKVTSTVVRLVPRPEPLCAADPRLFERVVGAAFGQRRKMLRSSLRQLGGDGEDLCRRAGIDPRARAETLSIESFCALARALEAITDGRATP